MASVLSTRKAARYGRLHPPSPRSEYEHGSVRLHAAIVAALAKLPAVSANELLGLKPSKTHGSF